jgi:hypothetical protein
MIEGIASRFSHHCGSGEWEVVAVDDSTVLLAQLHHNP